MKGGFAGVSWRVSLHGWRIWFTMCLRGVFFMAGVRFIDPVAGVCLWWFYSGLTAAFFVVVCVLGDIRFRLPQRLITIVCS